MKSWKTTTGGIILAIGSWASGQVTEPWLWKLGPLIQAIGAIVLAGFARDNNVPSAAIPSAAKAEEKIKRETAFLENAK